MSDKMKLLIAYDGSDYSEAALDDLARAGLPREAEALVLSVADVWLPPGGADDAASGAPVPIAVQRGRARAIQALEAARKLAERGDEFARSRFPDWKTRAEALADSPAWAVIKRASAWPADLIIVGSHGYSAIHRAVLGSTSQKIVAEAPCSVRIGRRHTAAAESPAHLLIGVDGSADANMAVQAVAARAWPAGSEVKLVAALDSQISTAVAAPPEAVTGWMEADDEDERAWVGRMMAAATEQLRPAGLAISSVVREGDPKFLLIEEAERWDADCIFVGARGHSLLERVLLGSVSAAVAARAHCSVEIVRPRQN
jgi:nucleotide-binding universal stress UspA family protein